MQRSITIEDLYKIKFLTRPCISPDGQRIAFVVTTIDDQEHEYRSSIWMVSPDGGEAWRFTMGASNTTSPSWSPDGRWLAFVSEREGELPSKDDKEHKKNSKGKSQVWVIPTNGGEARQLTYTQHGASQPVWSPDSKHLIYSATVGPADEESGEGKRLPKARVIDRLWYRQDGVGFIYERRRHFFLIDVTGGEPQQITDGDWDDNDPAWSPDGTRIAFTSNRVEDRDRWRYFGADLYILAIHDGEAGELRCLTDSTRSCYSPSWSPDGKTIAFLAAPKLGSANHFEHMLPAPPWSPDSKTLYVLASHRGATRVFAIASDGEGKQPLTLTPGNVYVRDFSIDHSRAHLALLIEDPAHVTELFTCATSSPGELRRITSFNDALVEEVALATPEYMPYTGVDGWPIDGWILKPYDFDPAKKYPMIVEIHGGPNSQYGYGFFHEMQVLAASGYVVLYTNPRGSTGYGREFALAVRGAWGVKDSLDILAGVDTLLEKGYIDEQRQGVIGGSYGGFMTNWLIGHTDRFKAAVTDRSVVNRYSFFGSSDIGWEFADDDMETTPWEDPDLYRRMSPITYVKQMHTPLLIIHSEQDLRCGIEQAEELFAALKYLGRTVLFVRFEGQSHGLSRGGHPKLRLERLRHIKGWFETYL